MPQARHCNHARAHCHLPSKLCQCCANRTLSPIWTMTQTKTERYIYNCNEPLTKNKYLMNMGICVVSGGRKHAEERERGTRESMCMRKCICIVCTTRLSGCAFTCLCESCPHARGGATGLLGTHRHRSRERPHAGLRYACTPYRSLNI